MKKFFKLFITGLILVTILAGCKANADESSIRTCDEEFSFLLANPVSALPSLLDDNTWYCFVANLRDKNGSVEDNCNYFMFVYIENDEGVSKWKYCTYITDTELRSNSGYRTIDSDWLEDVEYWCKITPEFYNQHADKLPQVVSQGVND